MAPFGLLAAIWWFYRNVRPDPRLRTLAECFAQILLLLLFGTLLSYAAAAAPIPFRDDALLAIDTALGFDRRAYIDFFDSRPWLFNTLTLSYFTFMPQFVVVLLVLFFAKQPSRMQQFVFAAGLALLVTDAISVLTPSITTIYLDLGLPVGAEIPAYRYTPLPTLQALRSGSPYWIDLDAIEGLISFPSFHTVGAVFFHLGLVACALRQMVCAGAQPRADRRDTHDRRALFHRHCRRTFRGAGHDRRGGLARPAREGSASCGQRSRGDFRRANGTGGVI